MAGEDALGPEHVSDEELVWSPDTPDVIDMVGQGMELAECFESIDAATALEPQLGRLAADSAMGGDMPMPGDVAAAVPKASAKSESGGPSALAAGSADAPAHEQPLVVHLENGSSIRAYRNLHLFEATCSNKSAHGRCVMSRTWRPASSAVARGANPFQGRPLGLLAFFATNSFTCCTKLQHQHLAPTKAERREARRALRAMPMTQALFDCERCRGPDEDSEPDFIA